MSEEKERLPDRVFKAVEKELCRYPRYKAAVKNYPVDRGDVLFRYRGYRPPVGDSPVGSVSDRTGAGALRLDFLNERLHKAYTMVMVIETVFSTLSDEQQDLVRMKYFDRSGMTNEQIIATMYLDHGTSRAQWYRMRAEIIEQFAEEMGLLPNGGPQQNAS